MNYSEMFRLDTLRKDAVAGTITGLMAIPLSIGICLMSEYPIQTGLATVVFASVISFITYLFRPGNHVGVPGIAAGLAPVLAMGIHQFGFENMPFIIFLTSVMQMLVWRYKLEGYILKAVPHFLIEGLLAGVGLKIAMKFLPYTYDIVHENAKVFWTNERMTMVALSVAAFLLFIYLYKKYKEKSPGVPYITIIVLSIWLSFYIELPMLDFEYVPFKVAIPYPVWETLNPLMIFNMVVYAAVLALIDVIEQVMSNAAIEKIDPLGRKSNSNNSLIVMWLANMGASFFGGMTNLDGLAKSATNRTAGAMTKTSTLFVALVISVVLAFPWLLHYLPEFSLAVLMIFTGWKMIAGLYNVAHEGEEYAFGLAVFCGLLVFQLGIFEGLLIALVIHSFIKYVIYRHEHIPTLEILKRFVQTFGEKVHPHSTEFIAVNTDPTTGALRYSSISRSSTDKKDLNQFIDDWAEGVNKHNLLSVVSTYDANGLLWGTFAKDLRAGHFHIKRYFEHLFELNDVKVHFESGEIRQYNDIFIKSGSYGFSHIVKGHRVTVPARYSFVCKKEKTGWYILEHHSSVFPTQN